MVDISKVSSLPYLATTSGTKVVSGSGSTTTDGTKTATDNAEDLKSQFLNILLTQMQNQNPLDPMDTKELTGQLAQFSSLEQQINTNSKLDGLLTAIQSTASTSAFNYIGQTAEIDSKLSTVQSGSANWDYAVSLPAASVNVKITDSTGKVLYTKDITNVASGTYSLKTAAADLGNVPDGTVLTLAVTAKDTTGASVRTDISTTVKVDGVESSASGIDLRAGGLLFSLDDVLRFKTTTPTTTTSTTSTTATT